MENWTNIIGVSAGLYHTVGLKPDGTVVAVGANNYGQCNVSEWQDIIAVGRNQHGECNVESWNLGAMPFESITLPEDTDSVETESSLTATAVDNTLTSGGERDTNQDMTRAPIKIGSKGPEVQRLQQALIDQGYLSGKADGDFWKEDQ